MNNTCVAHKFKYFKDGNLMSVSAHELVMWVNARVSLSKLPNEPMLNNWYKSVSVERHGNVSLAGPPFCCCEYENEVHWIVKFLDNFQYSVFTGGGGGGDKIIFAFPLSHK